jgi:hypothetical protein
MVTDASVRLSTEDQGYNPPPIINEIYGYVEAWRNPPNRNPWQVTPETRACLSPGGIAASKICIRSIAKSRRSRPRSDLAEVASNRGAASAKIWTACAAMRSL